MTFNRRTVLKGSLAAAAAGATGAGGDLFGFAKAWAATSPFKPEAGSKLTLTRWKRFVQAEDDAFRAIVKSFGDA
ncbi:MAG: twin-arginine translocation signal domain-containing protein, partial [Hyphomicrobiaceae bacterium]